jgi:hypothetical protein
MHARSLTFSLVALAAPIAAPIAHAQAPGEVAPQVIIVPVVVAPGAAPVAPVASPMAPMTPAAAPVAIRARESVMANRWSIGLSVGSMSLAPESAPDNETQFTVGELALRFRATPRFELELSAGGGTEQTADNQQGDLDVTAFALAARFRFRPEAAWNWFLMAGVGGAAVTRHDATDQEREDAVQSLGMLGVGIERRFRHVALQAEARAIGMGDDRRDADRMQGVAEMPVVGPGAEQTRAGGSLTLGLSYYF